MNAESPRLANEINKPEVYKNVAVQYLVGHVVGEKRLNELTREKGISGIDEWLEEEGRRIASFALGEPEMSESEILKAIKGPDFYPRVRKYRITNEKKTDQNPQPPEGNTVS